MLPDHGTTARYRRGCRCDDCRQANTRYSERRRMAIDAGRELTIDATGTRRRIEGLQWMGWSLQNIANESGWKSLQAVKRITERSRVTPATAERITETFERLCMTIGPSQQSRDHARNKGFRPPLAWTDIDNPAETGRVAPPRYAESNWEDSVDHAVVWRVVNRQPRPRRLTRAETEEVVQILAAKGVGANSMERDYGVNVWRRNRGLEKEASWGVFAGQRPNRPKQRRQKCATIEASPTEVLAHLNRALTDSTWLRREAAGEHYSATTHRQSTPPPNRRSVRRLRRTRSRRRKGLRRLRRLVLRDRQGRAQDPRPSPDADWSQVEPVDILTGGSPCQDLSHAGRRAGMTEGTRSNLWVAMREAIAQLRPRKVIWENVRGAYSAAADSAVEPCAGCVGDRPAVHLRALGRVLGDLSDLGYDCRWHGLRAADVGAPHGRFRVFVVATDTERGGRDGWPRASRRGAGRRVATDRGTQGPLLPTPRSSDGDKGLRTVAGAASEFDRKGNGADLATVLALLPTPAVNDMGEGKTVAAWDEWTAKMKAAHGNGNGHGASLAIELQRVESGWGPYASAVERWQSILGREAPPPSDGARVREWMMGLPAGWVTDVPGVTRNEAIKALGNGVVPKQAAAAMRVMETWGEVAA